MTPRTEASKQDVHAFRANEGVVERLPASTPLPQSTTTDAGASSSPSWFHNLNANPHVTKETGTETFEATARIHGRRAATDLGALRQTRSGTIEVTGRDRR